MEPVRPQDSTPALRPLQGCRAVPAVAGPVAVLCGSGAVGVYLAANDPARGGWYPECAFHGATGLWCPGCGLTRGAYRLLHGDVAGALGSNPFLPVIAVLVAVGWWSWWQASLGRSGRPLIGRIRPAGWSALVVAFLAFGVLRNLAPFAALAP